MLQIGALEVLVISVVALIVVGPKRLPKLARTAGLWVGRARRAFSSVKEEIDREIKADELREILRKQAESRPLDTILEEAAGSRPAPKASGSSSPKGSVSTLEGGSGTGSDLGAEAGAKAGTDTRSAAAEPSKDRL